MKVHMFAVAVISVLLTAGLPATARGQSSERCFIETGSCIVGRIREFWEQNGGLRIFGLPITPQRTEVVEGETLEVQWFERSRLELHPQNARPFDVLPGRVGAERLTQQGRDWFQFPRSTPQRDCRFFESTGHNICGAFLNAWRASGVEFDGRSGKSIPENIVLFGMPLSDEQTESIGGSNYTVQWFERARFEWHPENQPPYNVLLGRQGNEINERLPDPRLPEVDARALEQVMLANNLKFQPLARDHTVIYTQPGPGVALMLTALESAADIPEQVLLSNPVALSGVVLGGLTVIQPITVNPTLAPGHYVITPSDKQGNIRLVAERADQTVDLPLAIRERPRPARRPFALISANQICLGLRMVVGCALVRTPPSQTIRARIEAAFGALKVEQAALGLERALPDIDDFEGLAVCEQALSADMPDYRACQPTMLIAPAVAKGSLPAPDEPGFSIAGIGLLVALTDLDVPAYLEPTLRTPVEKIPPGDFTAFEVRRPEDPKINEIAVRTRIRLLGPPDPTGARRNFYLPSFSDVDLFGVLRSGPDPQDTLAIVDTWVLGVCTDLFGQECDAVL